MKNKIALPVLLLLCLVCSRFVPTVTGADDYDVVILNGRVMDPESKLDAVRNIGIRGGSIQEISTKILNGKSTIDAKGLVVAPGFIDLHAHGQDDVNYRFKAMDGVTTALEFEGGTAEVAPWYSEREGKALINHGVSVAHSKVRMALMHDPGPIVATGDAARRAATAAEIVEMKRRIAEGLKQGALAVGFGIVYTPAASRFEILEMFRVAAQFGARAHVHVRNAGLMEPVDGFSAIQEVIADAAVTGAPAHIVHIDSMGLSATPRILQMLAEAQSHGIDISAECYGYDTGGANIESPVFDEGWQERQGLDYKDIEWAPTGERLTAETFAKYRKMGGLALLHENTDEIVRTTVAHPLIAIASDGRLREGRGHPRSAGTYARMLGHWVREEKALPLMEAIRKMSLLPAQLVERRAPMLKKKGRIRVGADADLSIFDAVRVIDKATFAEPAQYSQGFQFVLVNGTVVVKEGRLQEGVFPGIAVRAPIH